jgi:hypothetical protein
MEIKNINDLKPNQSNPRTITKQQFDSLKKSMKEFGDLSPITFNETTEQLVGGHMRIKSVKDLGNANVQITQKFDTPTRTGTTAVGYVIIDGDSFGYRQVRWPLERELAANVAANNIQGRFDNDLLGQVIYQIQQESEGLLELVGFDQKEIDKLLKQSGAIDDEPSQEIEEPKLVFKITSSQKHIIEQVIRTMKIDHQLAGDDETINGQALMILIDSFLVDNPINDDTFTPPEIPEQ